MTNVFQNKFQHTTKIGKNYAASAPESDSEAEHLLPNVVNPSAYTKAKAGTGTGSKRSASDIARLSSTTTKPSTTKVKAPRKVKKAEVKS